MNRLTQFTVIVYSDSLNSLINKSSFLYDSKKKWKLFLIFLVVFLFIFCKVYENSQPLTSHFGPFKDLKNISWNFLYDISRTWRSIDCRIYFKLSVVYFSLFSRFILLEILFTYQNIRGYANKIPTTYYYQIAFKKNF